MSEVASWPLGQDGALGIASRSGRRRMGWNQRQLAERAGVSQATVRRLEAGNEVTFHVAVAVLAAVGLRVVAVGAPVQERPEDGARDTGGRRLPAHLDARRRTLLPIYTYLRRAYRGGPLIVPPGDYWVFERPVPEPGDVPREELRREQP